MKKVWFLTHDDAIDRRIFFFTDFFRARGCDVKLFPGFCSEAAADPPFIKRPVNKLLLKQYLVSREEIPSPLFDAIGVVSARQLTYYAKARNYAENMRMLGYKNKEASSIMLETSGAHGYYTVVASDGAVSYMYDSITDSYSLLHHGGMSCFSAISEAGQAEKALYNFLSSNVLSGVPRQYGDYTAIWYIDESGEKVVRLRGYGTAYEYYPKSNRLYKYKNNSFVPARQQISFDGLNVDFPDFRDVIYNYSPILGEVNKVAAEPPDIVYVADLPTVPIGILIKRTTGCKLIIDCHEWWMRQSLLWESFNHKKIQLTDKYEKLFYREADICITVGKKLAKAMGEYYGCRFETIYSCVNDDLREFTPEPRFKENLGLADSDQILVFQGSMTELRNLENLAYATKYFEKNNYLVICGGGPLEQKFKNILISDGDESRVIFVGWIPQKELMRYTVNADAGIIPYVALDDYFAMSLPNKLMEYFNASLPIVCDSSILEVASIVEQYGVGVTTDCRNPKKLAETINSLLGDVEKRTVMRTNYQKHGDIFSQDAQNQVFEDLLERYL